MGLAFYAVNPYFILSYSRVLPLISCSSSGELGCPLITVAPLGEDLGRMGEMATGRQTLQYILVHSRKLTTTTSTIESTE